MASYNNTLIRLKQCTEQEIGGNWCERLVGTKLDEKLGDKASFT